MATITIVNNLDSSTVTIESTLPDYNTCDLDDLGRWAEERWHDAMRYLEAGDAEMYWYAYREYSHMMDILHARELDPNEHASCAWVYADTYSEDIQF